ncbi:MAG: hypothetical protein CEE40_07970 [Chloroflexi bacterium B3_Chlor]|nr:MAG: hypothetical protein CEE40_07970 [Chloroflexi bacterium B3_Chlor]
MNWTSLRDRVGEWGPMAFCALLSLSAFYLLILQGASLSKVILLGVMLACPVAYFITWLLGGNPRGRGPGKPIRGKLDAVRGEASLVPPTSAAHPRKRSKVGGAHRMEKPC